MENLESQIEKLEVIASELESLISLIEFDSVPFEGGKLDEFDSINSEGGKLDEFDSAPSERGGLDSLNLGKISSQRVNGIISSLTISRFRISIIENISIKEILDVVNESTTNRARVAQQVANNSEATSEEKKETLRLNEICKDDELELLNKANRVTIEQINKVVKDIEEPAKKISGAAIKVKNAIKKLEDLNKQINLLSSLINIFTEIANAVKKGTTALIGTLLDNIDTLVQ